MFFGYILALPMAGMASLFFGIILIGIILFIPAITLLFCFTISKSYGILATIIFVVLFSSLYLLGGIL